MGLGLLERGAAVEAARVSRGVAVPAFGDAPAVPPVGARRPDESALRPAGPSLGGAVDSCIGCRSRIQQFSSYYVSISYFTYV